MKYEVLLALILKVVDDELNKKLEGRLAARAGARGPRGPAGESGKDFDLKEHENEIKAWAKEYALKFSDLSESEIESLRGPKGLDGARGPRGDKGEDGQSFIFSDHSDKISEIIKSSILEISPSLKLNFSDLTEDEKNSLRGARGAKGQRGPAGKDFNFEEHIEFFKSLKLTFSDLSNDEKESLKLKFSHLTEGEKNSLKLKFTDLTEEEMLSLKGARGAKGQRGSQGEKGEDGARGPQGIRGSPGVQGIQGRAGEVGPRGADGKNGKDAPRIVDIQTVQIKNKFYLSFHFSDGSEIKTDDIILPKNGDVYVPMFAGGGSSSSGGGGSNFSYILDSGVPSNSLGLDGDIYQDLSNGDQYKKISGSWALQGNLKGADGADGANGSQYYFGTGVPLNTLGSNGDIYQNTVNGDQYKKVAGAWVFQDNLTGPAGSGGSGTATELLENIECETDVYVGAAVYMKQSAATPSKMSDWTFLSNVYSINYSIYTSLAANALADDYATTNVIGLVESKSAADRCTIRIAGITAQNYTSLDVAEEYYLSDVVPGGLVTAFNAPTTPTHVLVKVGQPISFDRMLYQRGERVIRA